MRKSIFIIALGAAVAACNSGERQNAAEHGTAEQKTGAIASSSELYGKEWKLSELNGKKPVLDPAFQQYPYFILQKENRISGNLGCNSFGGNIEFQAGDAIKITGITATEMACPNLEVEQGLLDVLNKAKAYSVVNNVLTLSNDKKEITARFEGVIK